MQGLDLASFAPFGQGHGERGCRRCPLPTRRGVTTTCTADNRETNSTAPEYSVLAAHHPGACCPGGCRRSGLAQKCCLRLAFAFDSDMESGNGRVPEPWCRVTDQMSQAALRWP